MKWLFLLLLLVNIGLFIWTYPQYQEQLQQSPAPSESVERLLLLSEVQPPEETRVQPEVDPKELASSPSQEGGELSAEAVASAEVEPSPSPAIQTEPPEPVEEERVSSVQAAAQEKTAPVKEVAELKLSCEMLGPVSKRVDADKLSVRLGTLGVQPDISSESRRDSDGYWVLVPPQASRSKAVEIVNRLKKAGVKDLWRFTSGTLAHAISLGLFRDEGRAEARRSLIAGKGFDVEVRPRFRQLTDYWLSYNYKGESPITEGDMTEFKEDYPELEHHIIACPEIARP
jgi:cell division protein FtsN